MLLACIGCSGPSAGMEASPFTGCGRPSTQLQGRLFWQSGLWSPLPSFWAYPCCTPLQPSRQSLPSQPSASTSVVSPVAPHTFSLTSHASACYLECHAFRYSSHKNSTQRSNTVLLFATLPVFEESLGMYTTVQDTQPLPILPGEAASLAPAGSPRHHQGQHHQGQQVGDLVNCL